jgi:hypothetical protein
MPVPERRVAPDSLSQRAADDLKFIRNAMARTATFTAVPGAGGAVMGVVGLAAAIVAARQPTADRWLGVWLISAALAFAAGVAAIVLKAQRHGLALDGPTTRNFSMGLIAPLAAGAAITYALWSIGAYAAMPGVWLLLYGTGVLVGGMFSVAVVRITGALFMLFGVLAVATPSSLGNLWLGVGFGVLQFIGGLWIARKHGG